MNEKMQDAVSELGAVLADSYGAGYRKNPYKLAKRIIRRQDRKEGQITPIFLVVVETWRCFGGSEEGGWWYDKSRIADVRKVWGVKNGVKALHELREEYPQPRFNRYSCANRGEVDYHTVICGSEDEFPSEQLERQTYG